MTPAEKTTAIAVLDANIPSEQTPVDGLYVQVVSHTVTDNAVTYTLRLDQYLTPSGGAGYCRYISCPEDGDPDLINVYADPFGPEPWASGWSSGRGNG
jgi:hypothetical protein